MKDLLVAIDPGTRGLGLSIWAFGQLVRATYTTGLGGQPHPLLEIVPYLNVEIGGLENAQAVVELPMVYQTQHQKGDQADIVNVAVVVGICLAELSRAGVTPILTVVPRDWKGNLPKDVCAARAKALLSEDEIKQVALPKASSLHHNVWDAVALGQWRLNMNRISGR